MERGLCEPQHVPLQIKPLRVTDPRSVSEHATFGEVSERVEAWSRMFRCNSLRVEEFW